MSVYASFSGVGGLDDDPPLGQPWQYLGSHVLPDVDDLRGGSIGLAFIPGHITRDGRDGQPDDLTPWPWLRLSVSDPDLVLDPAQALHLAAQLTGWAASTGYVAGGEGAS